MVQMVWTAILCVSGSYGQLLDYIIFAVLVFYILTIFGLVRFAPNAPGSRAPIPRRRISRFARHLHRDGFVYRHSAVTLQAAIHVAGIDHRAAGHPGVLFVVAAKLQSGNLGLKEKLTNVQSVGYQAA